MIIPVYLNSSAQLVESALKGFGRGEGNSIELISKIIEKNLRIQCSVLMGANLANEVAEEKFCETTIGEYIIPTLCTLKLLII